MNDYYQTAFQAMGKYFGDYIRPSSFSVNHRLDTVNGLCRLVPSYDFFLLDLDCTLRSFHGKARVPQFEKTLRDVAKRSEIASNSSFETMLKIRDLYSYILPVSKLVKFKSSEDFHIIRCVNGWTTVYTYDVENKTFSDQTGQWMSSNDELADKIEINFKKPDPLFLTAIIDFNIHSGRLNKKNPRVLMVGDRYLTDIVGGNLAGIDTAIVTPYDPGSETGILRVIRPFDTLIGSIMSRIPTMTRK